MKLGSGLMNVSLVFNCLVMLKSMMSKGIFYNDVWRSTIKFPDWLTESYTGYIMINVINFISNSGARESLTGKSVQNRCGPAAVMLSVFYDVTGNKDSWEDKTRDEAEPEDLPEFVRYLHLASDRKAFFFVPILCPLADCKRAFAVFDGAGLFYGWRKQGTFRENQHKYMEKNGGDFK